MCMHISKEKKSLHSLKCNSFNSTLIRLVLVSSAANGRPSSCYSSSFACHSFLMTSTLFYLYFVSYILPKMTFDSSSTPQSSYFSHRWRLSLHTDERGSSGPFDWSFPSWCSRKITATIICTWREYEFLSVNCLLTWLPAACLYAILL